MPIIILAITELYFCNGLEEAIQPERPPLPVLRKRPVYSRGNHASRVIWLLFEVSTAIATRHISADTTWEDAPQVTSLSGSVRLVPPGTYSTKFTWTLGSLILRPKLAHLAWKASCFARTAEANVRRGSRESLVMLTV